jgi:hypothetical protein
MRRIHPSRTQKIKSLASSHSAGHQVAAVNLMSGKKKIFYHCKTYEIQETILKDGMMFGTKVFFKV